MRVEMIEAPHEEYLELIRDVFNTVMREVKPPEDNSFHI